MERVSILLPARNEAPRIAGNVARVCATAQRLIDTEWRGKADSYEVIVVDDGSTDGTWAELGRIAAGLPSVVPVRLPFNYGKGMALRQAFQRSTGSWIFFIDADLDIAPEHMADLSRVLLKDNVDAVLGSKQIHETKTSYPWYRRVVSFTLSFC